MASIFAQVSSIVKENKFLMEILQETKKDLSSDTREQTGKSNEQKEAREGKISIPTEKVLFSIS